MQKTLIDLKTNLQSPIPILCWALGTIFCTITGPFGTYETDTVQFRFLFSGSVLLIATVYALFCYHAMRNIRPQWRFFQVTSISTPVFSITYSIFIIILLPQIYVEPLPSFLLILTITSSVTFVISCMMYLLDIREKEAASPQKNKKLRLVEHENNPFLSRINSDMGTKLIRLTMRDHYVEVHTCRGMQLIHERFSDAVAALTEFNGQQVHRSHWVNLDEVCDIIKKHGKLAFKMTDGFEVPISRGKMKELKRLGLLE